jgi:ABC-type oligopeptide transport system ATPase subunit
MTQSDALLSVRGLEKHFPITKGLLRRKVGAVQAVDGVSFDVHKGETLGLVGESGCGKTTTGRLLTRLLEPTGGSITFEGRDISHLSQGRLRPLRRDMQMIFQDPFSSLNPRHTVGTIVGAPFRIQKVPTEHGIKRAVQDLLALVGLNPEHYNRYPHEFSGGSASASASPVRWPCGRSSSSPTSRSPPWTCRSRRRWSTCSTTCRTSSTSPTS